MTSQEAFEKLVKHTEDFLKHHLVRVPSVASGAGGAFWIFDDQQNEGGKQSFKIVGEDNQQPGQFQFNGSSIHVLKSDEIDIENIPATVLGRGTEQPALTVKLTGCSVVMQKHHDRLLIAHIQPIGISGDRLEDQLKHRGKFRDTARDDHFEVYGRHQYPDLEATALAIRDGHTWRVYTQSYNLDDRKHPIKKVDRIYKAEL
jgi:hypothetical protein